MIRRWFDQFDPLPEGAAIRLEDVTGARQTLALALQGSGIVRENERLRIKVEHRREQLPNLVD
jgi:hypothetical protein